MELIIRIKHLPDPSILCEVLSEWFSTLSSEELLKQTCGLYDRRMTAYATLITTDDKE